MPQPLIEGVSPAGLSLASLSLTGHFSDFGAGDPSYFNPYCQAKSYFFHVSCAPFFGTQAHERRAPSKPEAEDINSVFLQTTQSIEQLYVAKHV